MQKKLSILDFDLLFLRCLCLWWIIKFPAHDQDCSILPVPSSFGKLHPEISKKTLATNLLYPKKSLFSKASSAWELRPELSSWFMRQALLWSFDRLVSCTPHTHTNTVCWTFTMLRDSRPFPPPPQQPQNSNKFCKTKKKPKPNQF